MKNYAYYADAGLRTRMLNVLRRAFTWGPQERILARWVSGRAPESLPARLVPPEYIYPPDSWRKVERHGASLRLDLSNTTDHGAFFDLSDPADASFHALLKPTDTIVDIGANIGIRTLAFARAAPQGRVVSFEPHPRTYQRLLEHVQLNHCTHVITLNMGIGEERTRERLFEVVGSNSGMNRILPPSAQDASMPSSEITITPLDDALDAHGIGHVNAIKIDVEGYEMHVLRGCRSIIRRDRPLLFIEVDDDNLQEQGASAAELIAWLTDERYSVTHGGTGHATPADLAHCHFDVICTPLEPL